MARKRKIIVHIAVSADGFIARLDGSFDWLERPRPKGNYGMGTFYKSIDTILWGRKTCDVALDFQEKGVAAAAFDTKVKNYVFTRTQPRSPLACGRGVRERTDQGLRNPIASKKRKEHLDDGGRRHHCVVSR